MSEYNDTAMNVTCPECGADPNDPCMGRSGGGTTYWYLDECHERRYELATRQIARAVQAAEDATA